MLHNAYRAWLAQDEFRMRRRRFKNFTYGQQWADPTLKGESEYDLLVKTGRKPLTNNLIRRLVKTLIGRWRASVDNDIHIELDARMLEEYLISGAAVQRIGRSPDGEAMVENVSPDMFFINAHTDPLGRDVEIVGQLHSLPLAEILRRFAEGDKSRAGKIMRLYSDEFARLDTPEQTFGPAPGVRTVFFHADSPEGTTLHRVIEVWNKESRQVYLCHDPENPSSQPFPLTDKALSAENRRRSRAGRMPVKARWTLLTGWYGRFFAPDGTVLAEGFSPYAHHGHPFAFRFYPLTDGEVHPFVEDLIDQQQYINRLIVSIDHTMQTSAKGVLLFPQSQLVPGMSIKDVAERWSRPEGVIPVTGRGDLPQQVVANVRDSSAYQLLDLQMKLFEDVSGVSDALLGQAPAANQGAEVYKARVENSSATLSDIFATFNAFIRHRDGMIRRCG